jgi:eukaryotic-like serine/threonine-protein kinase
VQGSADIEALVAAGKHAEAAAELRRAGELERAQALYEKIWDFRAAADVARERGDRPALLRLLLDAKELAEAARVGHELLGAPPGEQARAADVYERRRMWAEAAQLRETLGQLDTARELYARAQQPLEAARVEQALGRAREAGLLYEKFLANEPRSPDAPRAHFELGRILGGFQRPEDAARHLQRAAAAPDAELAARARRLLVCVLAELGYRDGASATLDELRRGDPRLPPLDAFLAAERRAQLGDRTREARLGGRYAIARLLGSGGMGRVYLARDELTGRDVAVKVVAPPVDERLRVGYQRFVREARVVSSLHHPNLVGVIAFHEELGLLAMVYMAGGTLADRLPGPLAPAAVRSLLLQVAAGLEAAHAHGVIHRDLKPANIFFAASGEAKLGDFGVAHLQDVSTTQTAGFIGTLAYMSPEQISGATLSFATDVYALGVTAYQALTGRLPFGGPDFVSQHLGETAPRPTAARASLHPAWDAFVSRALEKAPQARFASLEELRRTLAEIPVDLPDGARAQAAAEEPEVPATASDARYASSARLTDGESGTLDQATDTVLGRTVMVEELRAAYVASDAGAAHHAWLRAMARAGGPHLQRVLRLEKLPTGALRVVYEAVSGRPVAPAALDARGRARLRAALGPLHDAGVAHGAIATSIVLEDWGPTLVVAGRRPTDGASPERDRAALGA